MWKILLKSVKMQFSGNTEILEFQKGPIFFTGFRFHFFLKIGTFEIVNNRFAKTEVKFIFLKKIASFDQKCIF